MEGRAKPRAIGVVALSGASAKDSLPGGGTSSPCETGAEGISDSGPRPRRQLPGQACRKTGPDRPVMVHVGSDLPETQGLTWPYPLPMASPPVDGRSGSVRPSDANDTMAYRDVARAGPPRWLIGVGVTLAGAGLGFLIGKALIRRHIERGSRFTLLPCSTPRKSGFGLALQYRF